MDSLRMWPLRRWVSAAVAAALTLVVVAVPTAIIPTGVFGREVPPTAWSWPVVVISSVLAGMLFATYVRVEHAGTGRAGPVRGAGEPVSKTGALGGFLTYLAVGCPVCNKLALIALGYTGALRWFAPVQPYLAVLGIVLLGWALRVRLRGELACPVTFTPAGEPERTSS
ncbi:MAG: hypothetical protein ACK5MP_01885 [Nostocoides sp.]